MTDTEMPVPRPSDLVNTRVAANIRAAMAAQKVSGTKLAERMGMDSRWVQRRIAGDIDLTLSDLEWFAGALDIQASSLLPDSF